MDASFLAATPFSQNVTQSLNQTNETNLFSANRSNDRLTDGDKRNPLSTGK